MKVSDIIEELSGFNQDANVSVIVYNKAYEYFTFTWGGVEGVSKKATMSVSFYVDELCNEEKIKDETKYFPQNPVE